jgi:transcriptional regulator with XRE-family HTH domain
MRHVIKKIRESHNLNRAEFAGFLDVNPSTITRWEKGQRRPTDQQIGALLRVAQPEQQRALLEVLGIEDVTQFAADLLASAGVVTAVRVGEVVRVEVGVGARKDES